MAALESQPPSRDDAGDFKLYVRSDAQGVSTFEAAIQGARCANCIARIEGGVGAIPGVDGARLNLSTGKLSVSWRGRAVSPAAILTCVRALGYQAQPFEAGASLAGESGEGRFLLQSLIIAGMGTVFVMGLTDAVWYGGTDMSAALRGAFFWLAAAIAVPATLFGSRPFLISAWRSLIGGGTNMDVPISAAVILSLALSLYETLTHGMQTYFDAAVMLVFLLLIGRYLDYQLRDRARGAAQHLLTMQTVPARRIGADGRVETVAAKDIVADDRILLATGERSPVDAFVEDCDTLADVSLVTGESLPVRFAKGALLYAGTINLGEPVVLRSRSGVQNSLVADLARLLEAGQQNRSVYVRLADRAARAYVPFVTVVSIATFIGWWLAGASLAIAAANAITILVITCPCALGLAVPAVQIVATGRLFERGVFLKSGDALERLADIDMAVFDKTGTLTLGAPVLREDVPVAILESAARLARASRHPLARAIATAAGVGPVAAGVREIAGSGLEAVCEGRTLRLGSAAFCGMTDDRDVAAVWFRDGDAAPVRFRLIDRIRPDASDTLAALRARGIAVEMLTGDGEAPAAELAAQAGIATWRAVVGPREKAAYLSQLRSEGRRVLMVGDGINDAGALAMAHVSMAPSTAADVSQIASDMVLRGDHLAPIVEALDVARKAKRLVLQNFAFAALYNLTAIPLAVSGLVTPLVAAATMAGSSLIVTLNALRLMGGRTS
jgi:Cu2+-exporting ATPase